MLHLFWTLHFSVVFFASLSFAQPDKIWVNPVTHQFYDSWGRVRIFHGVNMVGKDPPHYRQDLLNQTRVDQLYEWGFNVVRTGVQWAGVEPVEGQINSTYLNISKQIVNNLAALNIWTLVEFHQDVLSTKYCLYDAIPLWLTSYSTPQKAFPAPLPANASDCSYFWDDYYLTEAAGKMFQDIYDNTENILDKFTSFWKLVAQTFYNMPSVIGYELMNEPFCGNPYDSEKSIVCLDPEYAGKHNLMPTWDKLSAAIRSIEEDVLIFYEPVTWGYFSDKPVIATGFSQVPGGPDYNNRSVLSWHFYCWLGDGNAPCDDQAADMFNVMDVDTKNIGGASFMTEFGYCINNDNGTLDPTQCEFVLDQADQYLQSWLVWDTKDGMFWDENGDINQAELGVFVRPYPRAIAGTPLSTSYSPKTGIFQLTYTVNPKIAVPTEIYAYYAWNYPNGYVISSNCSQLYWDQSGYLVLVSSITQDIRNCTVQIAPKP